MERHLKFIHRFYDDEQLESFRKHKTEVWHDATHSYSTNGFVLIRVLGSYGTRKVDDTFPSVDSFDWSKLEQSTRCTPVNGDEFAKFKRIRECKTCDPRIQEVRRGTCSDCHGSGEVECWHCGSDVECDECGGTGGPVVLAIPRSKCPECFSSGIKEYTKIQIDGYRFNAGMLCALSENLPDFRLLTKEAIAEYAYGFKFGGTGTGAIMAMKD